MKNRRSTKISQIFVHKRPRYDCVRPAILSVHSALKGFFGAFFAAVPPSSGVTGSFAREDVRALRPCRQALRACRHGRRANRRGLLGAWEPVRGCYLHLRSMSEAFYGFLSLRVVPGKVPTDVSDPSQHCKQVFLKKIEKCKCYKPSSSDHQQQHHHPLVEQWTELTFAKWLKMAKWWLFLAING